MKILMAHNFYQNKGGEGISFIGEADLLEERGHTVIRYTRDNAEIEHYNRFEKIQLSMNTVWSRKSFRDFKFILNKENPDLVHFQNTFPLISQSAIDACTKNKVPVIMSLRNYRMMCLNGLFLRDIQPCETCIQKTFAWPGIFYKCYRGSYLQSTVVAIMNAYHKIRRTWFERVNAFICLSEFSKKKYVQGGLPEKKIQVVPNFMVDPGSDDASENYAVFIGRLSLEKGIKHLLEATKNNSSVKLKIIGVGNLLDEAMIASEKNDKLQTLGWLEHDQTIKVLKKARFLVCPSIWYETFGRIIMEAYACGVPVIGSRIGAIKELVEDEVTGLLVNPGDAEDLYNKMKWMWEHPLEAHRMGKNAHNYYLKRLTPDAHYVSLMQVYTSVLEGNQ